MCKIWITILIPQTVLLTKTLPGYRKGSENTGAGGTMWARLIVSYYKVIPPNPLPTTHVYASSSSSKLSPLTSLLPLTPHHFLFGPPYLAPRQDDPSTFQKRKLDSLVASTLQNLCLPSPYVSILQASARLCSHNTHFSVFRGSFASTEGSQTPRAGSETKEYQTTVRTPAQSTPQGETRKDRSATGPEAPLPLKILLAAAAAASFVRYIPFLLLCMTCLREEVLGGCIWLAELCHVPALQLQRRLGKWGLVSRAGGGGLCLPGRLER